MSSMAMPFTTLAPKKGGSKIGLSVATSGDLFGEAESLAALIASSAPSPTLSPLAPAASSTDL